MLRISPPFTPMFWKSRWLQRFRARRRPYSEASGSGGGSAPGAAPRRQIGGHSEAAALAFGAWPVDQEHCGKSNSSAITPRSSRLKFRAENQSGGMWKCAAQNIPQI